MADNGSRLGFKPPHPGEIIREDILPELGLTVSQLAAHLKVSRNSASRLINERSAVSLEMAVRLGQAFQNGTRFWLALQMQHDLWNADRDGTIKIAAIARPVPSVA